MKRAAFLFAVISSLFFGSVSFAAVKAGASCTKAGATSVVSNRKFTCIKSGKKLVWDKGVVVKKAPVQVPEIPKIEPSPQPTLVLPNSSPTIPAETSKVIDLNLLPINLEQPIYVNHSINSKEFTINFKVIEGASGGYIEVKELNLDSKNTATKKNAQGIVEIHSTFPSSFNGKNIKVFLYAYSEKYRSSCCSSIDLDVNLENKPDSSKTNIYGGLNVNFYQTPTKYSTLPQSVLTNKESFTDLSKCRLKDGDPILDNMTIGFPLPAGRTDLTRNVEIAVLGADFPNVQSTTTPANDYFNALKVMKHFWESQASTGLRINVNTSNTYKRMPKNIEDYKLGATLNGFQGDNYWAFIQDVIDAYDAEFDFSKTSTIAVVVPLNVTREQIGTWVVQTQSVFRTNEGSIYNVMITGNGSSKETTGAWVHEYGHALGLTDMRYVNDANPEIQKPEGLGIYDVMGSGNAAPEILVWSRFLTGMLLPNQIHCVNTTTESTHWLVPIEQQTSETKGLIIPLSEYTAIVVEARRNYGYDNIGTDAEGVIVYNIDTRIPYHRSPAHIVSPARSKDLEWYTDSALKVGESVTTNGWKISVIESGDYGDVVKVEKA